MGLGVPELLIIAGIVLLVFGPTAIVAAIFYAIGKNRSYLDAPPPVDESIDLAMVAARERYARGEIDKAQFEEIKTTLGY